MTSAERDRRRIKIPVAIVSLAAWAFLLVRAGGSALSGSCCLPSSLQDGFTVSSWRMLLEKNPPTQMALGWAIMVVAMMAPLMCSCIQHIRETSLTRRRLRAIGLFLLGYFVIWMAAAFVLLPIALTIRLFAPTSFLPVFVGAVLALIWQMSPVKQKCLNRKHAHPSLAPFGLRADWEAIRFGLVHGWWCFSSCWALMLLAELFPSGHLIAMALFTLWLLAEELDRPSEPHWRIRGIQKAYRVSVAQIQQWLGTNSRSVLARF